MNIIHASLDGVATRVACDSEGRILMVESKGGVYKISDSAEPAGGPEYFGFLRQDGYWFIMKITTSGTDKTYRYISGTTDYTTSWTGKAGLSYVYWNQITI